MISTLREFEGSLTDLMDRWVPGQAARVNLLDYEPECQARHELLLLVKPELTAVSCAARQRILSQLGHMLGEFGIFVSHLAVMSGPYLARTSFMEKHYSVALSVSIQGRGAMSDAASRRFREAYGCDVTDALVLGGSQFLELYPAFDAASLADLWAEQSIERLSGGTYCASVRVMGQELFVLNGFYPLQVLRFTDTMTRLISMVVLTDAPWRTLRRQFLGSTDPAQAWPGSIRRWLVDNQLTLGIGPINSMRNGLHLSAGPLEAATEIARVATDPDAGIRIRASDTCIGRRLLSLGVDVDRLEFIVGNPLTGISAPVFDLTEEMDVEECAATLVGTNPPL